MESLPKDLYHILPLPPESVAALRLASKHHRDSLTPPRVGLKSATERGNFNLLPIVTCVDSDSLYLAAAAAGSVPDLDWLKAQGYPIPLPFNTDYFETFCDAAAEHCKDLTAYQWLNENAPWDDDTAPQIVDEMCLCADINGRIDLLEWLHDKGMRSHFTYVSSIETYNWLVQKDWPIDDLDDLVESACRSPDFELARQLIATNHFEVTHHVPVCEFAMWNDDLYMLQWAFERGFRTPDHIYQYCAGKGFIEMFTWAMENHVPCIDHWGPCEAAANIGNLDLLKACREHGHPWGSTFTCATTLEILDWCKEQGHVRSFDECYRSEILDPLS